jgi:hypothetical protein
MPDVLLGKPAKPYPDSINVAVTRAVESVDGVAEAHFPQMWVVGQMEGSAQTLIIVLGRNRDEHSVMERVVEAVCNELPDGPDFPMIPLTGRDGLLSTVRGTGCRLYRSSTEKPDAKPWWRFW